MLSHLRSLKILWNDPLVKAEIANLRHQTATKRHWTRWLWRLFVILAFGLVAIPLWLAMVDSPRNMVLLGVMILAVYIVHLSLGIKTLTLASHSIARESQAGNWDNLVLTGVDARKIVKAKWLAVLSCVWQDYLWTVPLKLGLAYGLSTYFYNVDVGACYQYLGGGLCYFNPYNPDMVPLYRHVAIGLLGLVSLADAGLMVALGICFGSLNRRHRIVGLGGAAVFRGVLMFAATVIWILVGSHSSLLYEQTSTSYFDPQIYYRWNMTPLERQEILGSAQLVLSPLADSGTLLTTDLLRPVATNRHFAQRLLVGGIALAAFAGLIWLSLRLAEAFAVRQHALRPRERELRTQELAT